MSKCEYCEIECVLYEPITGQIKPTLGRCKAEHAGDCPAHISYLSCVDLKGLASKVRRATEKFMDYDERAATEIHDALGAIICYCRCLEALVSRQDPPVTVSGVAAKAVTP